MWVCLWLSRLGRQTPREFLDVSRSAGWVVLYQLDSKLLFCSHLLEFRLLRQFTGTEGAHDLCRKVNMCV